MEIKGEYQIGSSRELVWKALNDPDMLKKCIPGCESLEKVGDNELKAKVMVKIGPVKARFDTQLSLENLNPPESYTLVGKSKAGMAGFGRGSADVTLTEHDGGTLLSYKADFRVGGKLAQVGSRLVLGATKKTADDFFGTFSRELDPAAVRSDSGENTAAGSSNKTWRAIAVGVTVLLICWFLLR